MYIVDIHFDILLLLQLISLIRLINLINIHQKLTLNHFISLRLHFSFDLGKKLASGQPPPNSLKKIILCKNFGKFIEILNFSCIFCIKVVIHK